MKRVLIVLGGPDGSGKTTLALMLLKYFAARGLRVKVVRIRGTHSLAYVLMLFLRRFGIFRGSGLHYYNFRVPPKLRDLWLIIELISVLPLIVLYYYAYRMVYDVIIAERGVLDFAVWVLTGVRPCMSSPFTRMFLNAVQSLILRFKTIYITASREELLKRKRLERDLVNNMYCVYELLAGQLRLRRIDTTNLQPSEAFRELLKVLGELGLVV